MRLFHEVRSQPLLMLSTPDLQLMADFCLSRLYEDTRFKVAKLYYPEEKNRVAVERLHERIDNMDDSELIGLLRDILLIGETRRETWQTDPPHRLLEAATRIGIDPERVRAKVEQEAAMEGRIYRDPGNPELTWDGKGRKPLWLSIPEEAGRDIADFLVTIEPAKKATKAKGAKK